LVGGRTAARFASGNKIGIIVNDTCVGGKCKFISLDLADFREGTASVLKTVGSRLQTDIDDEDGG